MKYFPNLKTTDSELRALRHMSEKAMQNITPVFELTRSRKTKLRPNGSLERRAQQLLEVFTGSNFILDLCTEEGLLNEETYDLFDEKNGYENWQSFLEVNFPENITPCALYIEDGEKGNFISQVQWILQKYKKVCIRTSVVDEFATNLYKWALEVADERDIILCPIIYYIDPTDYEKTKEACEFYLNFVVGNRVPSSIIFAGSSFPRFVTTLPGCGDEFGSFELSEIKLEDELKGKYPNLPIQKADFASVHPRRYPTKGGTWVPRIDYVDGNHFRYSRFRRNQGGYAAAAAKIDTTAISKLPKCWGTDQIISAKTRNVPGASPSYWISVRINCWISMRSK